MYPFTALLLMTVQPVCIVKIPLQKTRLIPKKSLNPYGEWTHEALSRAINRLRTDEKDVSNFAERLVDNYFVNGLHDRMVDGEKSPKGPSCVALNSHLRLLPNGDIPVCLYNGKVVGNIRETEFEEIWFGHQIESSRQWVKACNGCWTSCETAVSAIYTGDIYKGLFSKRGNS